MASMAPEIFFRDKKTAALHRCFLDSGTVYMGYLPDTANETAVFSHFKVTAFWPTSMVNISVKAAVSGFTFTTNTFWSLFFS
jgi:hypothetical protein